MPKKSSPAHDTVVLDNEAAAALLVDHLIGCGYRRIGGLFGSTSSTAQERRAGYETAIRRAGLVPDIRSAPPNAAASELCAGRWLSEATPPDALILSNGLMLMGAVRAARSAGLGVPDVSASPGSPTIPGPTTSNPASR